MSNAELVKDLLAAQELLPEGRVFSQIWAAMSRAITALSSQDDVRDRALEDAAVYFETHARPLSPSEIAERLRAMKSKLTTEERRTWTRADDTTSPVRGKVEDRRKSEFGNRERAPEVKGQSLVAEWAAYRVNIDWERPATMLDLKIAMRAVGDELDTRLGEKS